MKRQELVEKWLEALESGNYKQGKGFLVSIKNNGESRFCCLGVACDVANQNIQKLADNQTELLSKNMQRKLGIDSSGSFIYNVTYRGKEYESLAYMNDQGVKFKTIARIIREQLKAKNFEKP